MITPPSSGIGRARRYALISSSDPRGLLDEGDPPPPGAVPSDGALPIVGAARGTTPLTLRSVLIAVEKEASVVLEIMEARLPPACFPNR